MTDIELADLAEAAYQMYANLLTICAMAESPEPDLQEAAGIAAATAEIAHGTVQIPRRFRKGGGDITVRGIWDSVANYVPDLARFSAAYRAQSKNTAEYGIKARQKIVALGMILDGVLACDNIRRALHGDLSRRVIAVDGPTEEYEQTEPRRKLPMNIKAHLKLDRLPADIRSILTNLRQLAAEVDKPPFRRLECAGLIGHMLNLIVEHVTLPTRTDEPGTSTSRQWIKMATKECLERMNRLYAASLKIPTDAEGREQFELQVVRELVSVFVTMRDIYLAPDVQRELRETDAQTE